MMLRSRKRRALFAVASLLFAVSMTMYLILNTGIVGWSDSVERLDMKRQSTTRSSTTGTNNSSSVTNHAVGAASPTLKSESLSTVKNYTVKRKRTNSTDVHQPARIGTESGLRVVETRNECNWVNFDVSGPPYFLTAVFIVRIYEKDLSEMTTAEIKQWLV